MVGARDVHCLGERLVDVVRSPDDVVAEFGVLDALDLDAHAIGAAAGLDVAAVPVGVRVAGGVGPAGCVRDVPELVGPVLVVVELPEVEADLSRYGRKLSVSRMLDSELVVMTNIGLRVRVSGRLDADGRSALATRQRRARARSRRRGRTSVVGDEAVGLDERCGRGVRRIVEASP